MQQPNYAQMVDLSGGKPAGEKDPQAELARLLMRQMQPGGGMGGAFDFLPAAGDRPMGAAEMFGRQLMRGGLNGGPVYGAGQGLANAGQAMLGAWIARQARDRQPMTADKVYAGQQQVYPAASPWSPW